MRNSIDYLRYFCYARPVLGRVSKGKEVQVPRILHQIKEAERGVLEVRQVQNDADMAEKPPEIAHPEF